MDIAWPLTQPFYAEQSSTSEDVDARSSFQPEFGPPITRLRANTYMETWSLNFMFETRDIRATFDAWYKDDLKQGSLPYIWRHPDTGVVSRWKMLGSRSKSYRGAEWAQVSFDALLLPGAVWYADYVLPPYVPLPYFVADYANGVYGVDGAKTESSALASVTGEYDVWTTTTSGSSTISRVTYGSGVPTTGAGGIAKRVGYPVGVL